MNPLFNFIHKNRYGLAVIFLGAIFLLPFLGMFPLIDPDEPVYGPTGFLPAFTGSFGMISRLYFTGSK